MMVRAIMLLPAITGAWRNKSSGVFVGSIEEMWNVDLNKLQKPALLNKREPRSINMIQIGNALNNKKCFMIFTSLQSVAFRRKNKVIKNKFRKKTPKVLYGGSVNSKNISLFSTISEIDGFLIGGASQSSKKFIDIVKNYYK